MNSKFIIKQINDIEAKLVELKKQQRELVEKLPKFLPDQFRDQIIDYMVEVERDTAFGDGQEEEMLQDGHTFVGYNNMSDYELIEQFEYYVGDDDMLEEAKGYLAELELLTKDEA